ncbi:MAG: ACP S-malonyltransferase [Coriobacteriia bacterium]|nr:ACP S-malonyltransferase [Coriobacteriia bacterium]
MPPRDVAFVFPGQGSQRRGMLDALPPVDALDRLLDAAEALTGLELRAVALLGSEEDLADTRVAQPLLYLADWAWGAALLEANVTPAALAGHSLGELAALALAGVYSVEAGLQLVAERSRLMAAAAAGSAGGMAAVLGMEAETVAYAVADIPGVWVANDNAPGQVVLSGTHEGLEAATKGLTEAGARKVVPLKVAGAFHSPLMQPAGDAFAEVLAATSFADALWPVVQNADPVPTRDGTEIRARLAEQITAPVHWTDTMAALRRAGAAVLVEAGPGGVLKGLARRVEGLEAVSVEDGGLEAVVAKVGA